MTTKSILVLIAVLVIGGVAAISLIDFNDSESAMMSQNDNQQMMSDDAMERQDPLEDKSEAMMEENDNMSISDETMMTAYQGTILAGSTSKVIDFNNADYENALQSKDLVVLYFYANWCPVCREEIPKMYSAFDELENEKVVAFRVNFNDNETDEDEENLARQFGVAYQHTKVFLKKGERILKSPESWDKDRYLSEIKNALK